MDQEESRRHRHRHRHHHANEISLGAEYHGDNDLYEHYYGPTVTDEYDIGHDTFGNPHLYETFDLPQVTMPLLPTALVPARLDRPPHPLGYAYSSDYFYDNDASLDNKMIYPHDKHSTMHPTHAFDYTNTPQNLLAQTTPAPPPPAEAKPQKKQKKAKK